MAEQDPFKLSKAVAAGQFDTVAQALDAHQGVAEASPKPSVLGLFPTQELPAQQQPSPLKLSGK